MTDWIQTPGDRSCCPIFKEDTNKIKLTLPLRNILYDRAMKISKEIKERLKREYSQTWGNKMKPDPKVAVAVILRDCLNILLGLRKGSHASCMWGCPGGWLEYGESFEDCALRETEEETGIILPSAELWTVENTVYRIENRHVACVFMIADLPEGSIPSVREPDKHENWLWHPWSRLPYPLMPGLQQLVDKQMNPIEV